MLSGRQDQDPQGSRRDHERDRARRTDNQGTMIYPAFQHDDGFGQVETYHVGDLGLGTFAAIPNRDGLVAVGSVVPLL